MIVFILAEIADGKRASRPQDVDVFAKLEDAQARAQGRADAEALGCLQWRHKLGSGHWHAPGWTDNLGSVGWHITEHVVEF